MGRSDPLIFEEYASMIAGLNPADVAFLGFSSENAFTRAIRGVKRHFYDPVLGNWNINSEWSLPMSYDLIVSTRCPYFAEDPNAFLSKCKKHLSVGGRLFIDWGLGDHWRFPRFKVGWVRDGEHEFAYAPENRLHSCLWKTEFQEHLEVISFWNSVLGRFGYPENAELDQVVRTEVPNIIEYDYEKLRMKFLWPESPQLYIMTLI